MNTENNILFRIGIEGTDQQAQRLAELRQELSSVSNEKKLLNKQYKDGLITEERYNQEMGYTIKAEGRLKIAISEVTQTMKAQQKEQQALAGSYDQMNARLGLLRDNFRRTGNEGILTEITQLDAKLKVLDASIGNHQRNIGNYAGGFNQLGFSVQQVARELPSLTISAQQFFLAISNNLPIMADNIQKVTAANKAMKAEGQATVPVWKQLISSVLSWQTALVVGITLLTAYGKDIINFLKGSSKSTKEFTEANKQASKTFSEQYILLKQLKDQWGALNGNLSGQKKFIEENKDEWKKLGIQVNNVNDAENIFEKNTEAVLNAFKLRAQAAAAQNLATKKYEEAFEKQLELEEKQLELNKKNTAIEQEKRSGTKITTPGLGSFTTGGAGSTQGSASEVRLSLLLKSTEQLTTEISDLQKGYDEAFGSANKFYSLSDSKNKEAADELKKAKVDPYKDDKSDKSLENAFNRRKKVIEDNNKEILKLTQEIRDLEVKAMQKGIAQELEAENNAHKKRIENINAEKTEREKANEDAIKEREKLLKTATPKQKEVLNTEISKIKQQQLELNKQYDKYLQQEEKSHNEVLEKIIEEGTEKQLMAYVEYLNNQYKAGELTHEKLIELESKAQNAREKLNNKKLDKIAQDTDIEIGLANEKYATEKSFLDKNYEYLIENGKLTTELSKKHTEEEKKLQLDLLNDKFKIIQKEIEARKELEKVSGFEIDKAEVNRLQEQLQGIYNQIKEIEQQYQVGDSFIAKLLGLSEEDTSALVSAAEQTMDAVYSAMLDLQAIAIDNELKNTQKKLSEEQKMEKKRLDDNYRYGLMSKAEYDKRVEKLEAETEAKQLQAEKQAFEKRKELAKKQAWIDFAVGAIKVWAQWGSQYPYGPILAAALTGLLFGQTMAQISTIDAQQFGQGGFLEGPSHKQGGIMIEAEGGEGIINKRSMSSKEKLNLSGTPYQIASMLNSYKGYGKKFAQGGVVMPPVPDIGRLATTTTQQGQQGITREEMLEAIGLNNYNLRVSVVETDISDTQNTINSVVQESAW